MPKRLIATALLAAAVLTGMSGTASAKSIHKMIVDTGLTDADFQIMGDAGRTLYVDKTAKVGAEAIWQNPETGSHGTVEVQKIEGNCVILQHLYVSGRTKKQTSTWLKQCKQPNGSWVLTP
ncbi:hypothetical protein [Chachezhania sediminis]|uniref:hypothetical protein n=1 Tax=Chachezhania sediminis TaxID=2599291 RepID=UPI00131AC698|nr:hypothetical protein [Chachezhania sediminis]